jgi:transposase
MPLRYEPGEAQVDYFFALVKVRGVLRKIAFFCMALPYSDMFFIMASPRECTESFWEGHRQAFEFFGGVPADHLRQQPHRHRANGLLLSRL